MKSKFFAALIIAATLALSGLAQTKPADQTKSNAMPETDSEERLQRAISTAAGSPTKLIDNLDGYLKEFPLSTRRIQIESEMYKLSLELRDRDRAIRYAEKLSAADEADLEVLTTLVTMLRERRGADDLQKALRYADRLVGKVEEMLTGGLRPQRFSQAQWTERKERGLASVYLLRGKVQADLNNDNAAQAELTKSWKYAKLAGAALTLGELAERRKADDEAFNHYLQAFVVSLVTAEEIDRRAVRRKLGQLYAAKQKSEAGLGDRILKAYDDYVRERDEHLAKVAGPNLNAGVVDPLLFKLTKLDGSTLTLGDFRGKVVVVNFWATWCGPCKAEMPLLEKTMTKYKDDKDVAFLAVSTDEERDDVPSFVKEHKLKLPIVYADKLDAHYRLTSIPTTMIFDRRGQVAFSQAGFNSREDFVAAMSERIEAAKKR